MMVNCAAKVCRQSKQMCLLAILTFWCSHAICATRIVLDDRWTFRTDETKAGENQGWPQKQPDQTELVSLPHTWNVGKYSTFEGTAWYFKTFLCDESMRGRHAELHFGATFYKARVWLNGVLLGEHEGGYSEYFFDVTSRLLPVNTIAVEINNQPQIDTIPGSPLKNDSDSRIYDWWPYGGIARDVWLSVGDPILVRWQHIDTVAANAAAEISDRIKLENHTATDAPITVNVAIYTQSGGEPVASIEKPISIAPGSQEIVLPLAIRNPHLWDFDNPYLYSVVATLRTEKGAVIDSITDDIGVRTIEIKNRHLYLNGRRVRLSGLARHEDSPWEGVAETRGTMLQEYDDLKNLQTTLTRPVHYPQNPFIYDYADRNGIILIPEIPMWQFSEQQMTNPKVIALAKRLFTEMVEQNYNHPSIFAWSTDNESATDTPGGMAYFGTMYALAKKLDPQRFVTFADDRIAFVTDPKTNASSLADFIMWNEYFGTWDGPASLLPSALDRIEKDYPNKMVIISEFGTPGIFATNEQTADQLRIQTIRKQEQLFAERDWIAGALLWCYQDYHSYHNLRPGQHDRYVDHGVVDQNLQRKPSYYAWQQENAPAKIHVIWNFDSKGIPVGFAAEIQRRPENELPSYPLLNYRMEWDVVDQLGKTIASSRNDLETIGPPQTVSAHWEAVNAGKLRLELRLYRPTGFLAVVESRTWRMPGPGSDDGQDQ